MFKGAKFFCDQYGISSATLRNWANNEDVKCIRSSEQGKRFYSVDDISRKLGLQKATQERKKYIYVRVSSDKQKEDLQRQREELQQVYPDHLVLQDIASGINFKRKGLCTLLELVLRGMVSEVVVAYKDRLCRFGYELFERIFEHTHTKLVVHSGGAMPKNATQELAEDLLAITTVFVAKNNGQRAQRNRKRRKLQESNQAPHKAHKGPATDPQTMDGSSSLDL